MPDHGPDVGAAMSMVPPPVGAWTYDPPLVPENTIVTAEPSLVVIEYPLVSSWPFSMTRTAPAGASMVTFPVSFRSPHTWTFPLNDWLPDHWLAAGSAGSSFLEGSCG